MNRLRRAFYEAGFGQHIDRQQFGTATQETFFAMESKMDAAELGKQLDALREVSARSINPCITAQFIALADVRVRDLLLKKVADGNVFRGIACLDKISIPENRHVYFDFDCPPDTFCIVKPAFAAIVNVVDGYVAAVVDPYVLPSRPSVLLAQLPISGATTLESDTRTLASDGTLPLRAGGGTLPLANDGTLPLRLAGYVLVPEGWRFGTG